MGLVGNSRMRAVDPSWPSPGGTIHHSIGVWPALLNDETVAVACEPLQELVLIAKGRPSGLLANHAAAQCIVNGCRIEMSEVPVSRPLKWLPRWAAGRSMASKSRCTWRLAALAERRKPGEVTD